MVVLGQLIEHYFLFSSLLSGEYGSMWAVARAGGGGEGGGGGGGGWRGWSCWGSNRTLLSLLFFFER